MFHFVLLNPNTSEAATTVMLEIAREALAGAATIEGVTASSGASTITDPPALAVAAEQVARMAQTTRPSSGVLVAAFGDPGLAVARARLAAPVTGLAEAAIAAAAALGRFSIVTTTPALDAAIRDRVAAIGQLAGFASIRYTRSGPDGMGDPERLHDELAAACECAVISDGAVAVIIGGGPLARAAQRLRRTVAIALVEPVPEAMRLMLRRATRS